MKALIFNSGRGVRMGELTSHRPKCMVTLYNGETILERQIRILGKCGIREFVITTGPYEEQLIAVSKQYPEYHFEFVPNKEYENTNYIVSMYNAREYIKDDILLLHGDLVFDESLVCKILGDVRTSLCLYDEKKSLPGKDFKGRFRDGVLQEVSVSIFDDDCYAFQPFYKLSKKDMLLWLESIEAFVKAGETQVYAENALNEVLNQMSLPGLSCSKNFIEEIDNEEDYRTVSLMIQKWDQKMQKIEITCNYADVLQTLLPETDEVLIVCSKRESLRIKKIFPEDKMTYFHGFSPNPKYEEIMEGVKLLEQKRAQTIVAVGGGSAIDVAKCIKLFLHTSKEDFLEQHFLENEIRLIAVPTTAGTGSESTAIAVMYYQGEKYSVAHPSILPAIAILDAGLLDTLPDYHKKSALADAYCQAMESYWSRGANAESRFYAARCILLIREYAEGYLKFNSNADKILEAANFSGKAIHISRTTAAHAMSYKLTTLYGISHGHAVAMCMTECFKKLYEASQNEPELKLLLQNLSQIMGCERIGEAVMEFEQFYQSLKLPDVEIREEELEYLVSAVNIQRLGNHPVALSRDDLFSMYHNLQKKRFIS